MKYCIFALLLIIAFLLETTIVSFPFVFVVLLVGSVLWPNAGMLVLGCAVGLLLDSIGFRTLGATGLFFLISLFIVFLYQQKFEIQTLPFVCIIAAVGSCIYILLFSYQFVLLQVILCSVFAGVIFGIYSLTQPKEKSL